MKEPNLPNIDDNRKKTLVEILKPGIITIKIKNENFDIKTPLPTRFWLWFWAVIIDKPDFTPDQYADAIIKHFNEIQAFLTKKDENPITKADEDYIMENQSPAEMMTALDELLIQITKEIKLNPFAKKALLLRHTQLRVRKVIAEKMKPTQVSGE